MIVLSSLVGQSTSFYYCSYSLGRNNELEYHLPSARSRPGCTRSCFAITLLRSKDKDDDKDDDDYYKTINFHKVLEAVGKTTLRPGGSAASNKLHGWATSLDANSVAIEVAAGMGKSGMELAKKYSCRVLETDIDQSRLDECQQNAKRLELDHLIETHKVNMFDDFSKNNELLSLLPTRSDGVVDCVLCEASLTHYPTAKKAAFFSSISNYTRQVLLHEVCFVNLPGTKKKNEMERMITKSMGEALRIGFCLETQEEYEKLLDDAGFVVDQIEVGYPLKLLNPLMILKDEGMFGAIKIFKNLITNKALRNRILSTRKVLSSHRNHLGYIIIKATTTTTTTTTRRKELSKG